MEVNYLRLGDKVFAVKEIANANIDINDELKQLYQSHINAHNAQFNQGVVQNVVRDWDTQCSHITKLQERSDIAVPQALFDKPLIVREKRLLECKVITYAPYCIRGSLNMFRDLVLNEHNEALFATLNVARNKPIYITVTPVFHMPLIMAYDPKLDKLYSTNLRTFHSYLDGTICTGNYTATDFWNASNLEGLINRINWYSPATHTIVNGIDINTILNNDTIVKFARQEEGTWTV